VRTKFDIFVFIEVDVEYKALINYETNSNNLIFLSLFLPLCHSL
jgi:hypothetical protein